MIIWAFEENPSCKFYVKIGGREMFKKTVNIGGEELIEKGFCWINLRQLLRELQ